MPDQPFSSPVTRQLDAAGVTYRVFTHPGQVTSLEQAAAERGQRPEQVVRSIVFRLGEGQYVMVLVAGGPQISWPKLRETLGVTRMSMATPDEVLARTGYLTGAVSPLGLPAPMRILVDDSVIREEEISIGSGVRNTTIILRSKDLQTALGEMEVGRYIV